ncbi:ATP synthase F1 subunit delta [Buchnera aphidicola]|uniref:ATP synthase subunit delta n=1 Tax=Buchnera aphidicola (Stegophylla sp.) TaxID=2315800 RepID=A0A4D6Y9Y1_9GAMM|nr:ATP synthase F1 subunit delta [Buchnera aphidicola (Stegophylla sp.)]QCI26209.1 ATP synthase F1 subunit delta [Buchnera aphidicola (Stegophylla sp.)]
MFKDIKIARLYAKAIFDFAIQNKSLKIWKEKIKLFLNICECQEMKEFICDIYPSHIILKIFLIIYNQNIDTYSKNLIKLLIINKRLKILKNIFIYFIQFYNDYYNIINIEIITPFQLHNNKIQYIQKQLTKKINKTIVLTLKKNQSILNGIILKSNNIVADICSMNYLNQLSNYLLS